MLDVQWTSQHVCPLQVIWITIGYNLHDSQSARLVGRASGPADCKKITSAILQDSSPGDLWRNQHNLEMSLKNQTVKEKPTVFHNVWYLLTYLLTYSNYVSRMVMCQMLNVAHAGSCREHFVQFAPHKYQSGL